MSFLRLPVFDELQNSRRVLVAGMGGGWDVYCGLPLYFGLRDAGKEVFLANLSFSTLLPGCGERVGPAAYAITSDSAGNPYYFPERHLCRWFLEQGEEVLIYAFVKTGVEPLRNSYSEIMARHDIDTVILIDGGTDSLMRGDEPELGTPAEDVASLVAVHGLGGVRKLLCCLGFGIDRHHGVCHTYFLEAVAELTRLGAFLGTWSLMAEMPEVQRYTDACVYALRAAKTLPSIVTSSILSAIAGQFDDFHATHRTASSTLFINPLMTQYWAFRLEAVAARLMYAPALQETLTLDAVQAEIARFRSETPRRAWRVLPM